MSRFIDEMVSKINKGIKKVSESSEDIVDRIGIYNSLKELESEKNRCFNEMGKEVYSMFLKGQLTEDRFAEYCNYIYALDRQINELK